MRQRGFTSQKEIHSSRPVFPKKPVREPVIRQHPQIIYTQNMLNNDTKYIILLDEMVR